ncbi:DUF1315 family protein [Simiduia curdlanivorans]|uniref:YeaC family protein n=1 Tax=Simiduia curdlanivorans TaxID=1492769 RepID=A0ABV8VAB0_9GAMM|nr:DUF1315 family protein [Simiduia curdlanivorans]MDN3639529.1 DUF1315 family protein [Simiduia curdlanivorans]
MDYQKLVASLTPELYASFKRAIELGKWPDGRVLTVEQKQSCIQAVIAYEHLHLPKEQHSGYIPPKVHSHCGSDGDELDHGQEKPIKWQH